MAIIQHHRTSWNHKRIRTRLQGCVWLVSQDKKKKTIQKRPKHVWLERWGRRYKNKNVFMIIFK